MISKFIKKLSLQTRFFIGTGIMLIPFLILAGVVFYSLNNQAKAFHEVTEETLFEKDPVMHIHLLIFEALIPANQYIMFGDPQARIIFDSLAQKVEKSFAESATLPFGLLVENETLQAAYQEWKKFQTLSNIIFSTTNPLENSDSIKNLHSLHTHFSRIADLLHFFQKTANEEIQAELNNAEVRHRKTFFVSIGVFIVAIFMAYMIGIIASRSILLLMRELSQGTQEFSGGNYKYRLMAKREDEIGKLMASFNSMAETIERTQITLKDQAIRDSLTGLFQRRQFFKVLHDEIERSRRYAHPLSLLMLDLDFFKKVNDTYGHPSGDHVLKTVAEVIQSQVRQTDVVCRYGGEEFSVLLVETDGIEAHKLAKRIREAVSNLPIILGNRQSIRVTISVGLASFPQNTATDEGLVHLADQALYSAKKSGRNCVFRSTEPTSCISEEAVNPGANGKQQQPV